MSTIIVVLGLLLFGCGKEEQKQSKVTKSKGYKIYYVNSNKEKIVYDDISIKSTDIDRVINEIIMKLKVGKRLFFKIVTSQI